MVRITGLRTQFKWTEIVVKPLAAVWCCINLTSSYLHFFICKIKELNPIISECPSRSDFIEFDNKDPQVPTSCLIINSRIDILWQKEDRLWIWEQDWISEGSNLSQLSSSYVILDKWLISLTFNFLHCKHAGIISTFLVFWRVRDYQWKALINRK